MVSEGGKSNVILADNLERAVFSVSFRIHLASYSIAIFFS